MSYMQELTARLERLLDRAAVAEDDQMPIIAEMKAIALESYRNGQTAGAPKAQKRKVAEVSPKGARPICASFGCGNPAEEDGEYCAAH